MTNPLAAKLANFAPLSADDRAELDRLCTHVREYSAGQHLIRQGDSPNRVFLLVEGWAYRYKLLPEGKRQIMAYLVPGDLCDIQVFVLKRMDHSLALLSDARVAAIPPEDMIALLEQRPALARAMWWSTLTDEAVLREWLVNIGQRDAYGRLAHLLAEVWLRLRAVGLVTANQLVLPLTQADLGDTLGLTSVHVNRTLQRLRAEGLIEIGHGKLHVPDIRKLMAASRFEPNYLHLDLDRFGAGPIKRTFES